MACRYCGGAAGGLLPICRSCERRSEILAVMSQDCRRVGSAPSPMLWEERENMAARKDRFRR